MAPPPNDTTKFELAFLIIWILVTVALIVLVVLKKTAGNMAAKSASPSEESAALASDAVAQGDKNMTYAFTFLQFVVFVLVLAAMANDSWTRGTGRFSGAHYGVAEAHGNGYRARYEVPSGASEDVKNYIGTIIAAGAFTLIFGIAATIVAFILSILTILSVLGRPEGSQFAPHVPMLSLLQFVLILACVMIWGVSGHDPLYQGNSNLRVGDSWILALVSMLFSIPLAMFFAGGATGSSDPAVSAPPPRQNAVSQPEGHTSVQPNVP